MYKVWVVARREYLALVTTKSFWVGLLLPPLLGVVVMLAGLTGPDLAKESGPKRVGLVDPSLILTPVLSELLQVDGFEVVPLLGAEARGGQAAFSERLRRRELLAVIAVPEGVLQGEPLEIYVENVAGSAARELRAGARQAVQLSRFKKAGLAEREVQALMQPVPLETRRPVRDAELSSKRAAGLDIALPFLTMILIMMGVMSGAVPLLQAVVEEKQQRISEVLLGAVPPGQLMLGKLLGTAAVGTTVLFCYLTAAVSVMAHLGLERQVPVAALGLGFGIAVIAMLMYGALYLALGAASSDLKEAQGLLTPAMLLFLAPVAALPLIGDAPHHPLSVLLSLFPLTSPLTMPIRLGVTETVPGWQVVVCVLLSVLTTALTVWAAGRVFRIGILSQGKLPSLRELGSWIVRG